MKRLALALAMSTVILTAHSVSAETPPFTIGLGGHLDHMVCYKVKDPLKLPKPTFTDMFAELQPEFTQRGCILVKPVEFCVPASKLNVDPAPVNPNITGQSLKNDYICYLAKCKTPIPPPDRLVVDQFGRRLQEKYRMAKVCVPAAKRPPGCGFYGNTCQGACPKPSEECAKVKAGGVVSCDCVDREKRCGGKPNTAGICTGACPDPAQLCVLSYITSPTGKVARVCNCQDPPTPICGIDPNTGQCGGNCPNATDVCKFNSVGKCTCEPAHDVCHLQGFTPTGPICGGVCPLPGQQCVPDPVTGQSCTCDPPAGCDRDPLTGKCGGNCPAPLVCILDATGKCECQDPPCSAQSTTAGTAFCGGTCPANEVCKSDATGACNCQPQGTTPCTGASACNPPCPTGQTCNVVPGTNFCRCQCDANSCTPPCAAGTICSLDAAGRCVCQ